SNLPRKLDLPFDFPATTADACKGTVLSILLPTNLSDSFRSFCDCENATLFMGLLAAFKALLCRYAGQEDIIVGSPVAGRYRIESENMIGCFVNFLMLRTNASGNPSFRELLSRVRDETLAAFEHQELPYSKVVDEIGIKREKTSMPMIQIIFSYDEA